MGCMCMYYTNLAILEHVCMCMRERERERGRERGSGISVYGSIPGSIRLEYCYVARGYARIMQNKTRNQIWLECSDS